MIVHRPDLPLWPGGPRVGLALWNSPLGSAALELALFAAGLGLYVRATRARDRGGTFGLALLVGLLLLLWVANLVGPPPPDATTVAVMANALWLFVAIAARLDRHRVPA